MIRCNRLFALVTSVLLLVVTACSADKTKTSAAMMEKAKLLMGRKQYQEAVPMIRQVAEQGNVEGQYLLGSLYIHGVGIAKDESQAVKWFEKSAAQGDTQSMHNLGVLHYQGYSGGAPDLVKSREWYEKAATRGLVQSQVNLARMYEYGWGTSKDFATAMKWYQKAAEQGDAYAYADLGLMYENGRGIGRDYAKAIEYYQKAASQKKAQGYSSLAQLYATCEDPKYRDGVKAMENAQSALALIDQDPSCAWMIQDAAAMANARCGQYDKAVEAAEKSIKLLESDTNIPEREKNLELTAAKKRLDLFRKKEPYTHHPNKDDLAQQ